MPSAEDIIATHRPIVEAIVAGDGRFAERILRDHNETAGRVLFDFLSRREAAGQSREAPPPARVRNRGN